MKYRKKPVVIEAVQWTGTNADEVREFMGFDSIEANPPDGGTPAVRLTTVHGDTAWARRTDWIIPEAEPGRFYPCNADVFAATYGEAVDVATDSRRQQVQVQMLNARILQLSTEMEQVVDGTYRDAVRDLVSLFHPRSAGLQQLRQIGHGDHKISLGDVVSAVRMHVEPNTLGAPDGYVSPAPPSPEELTEIQTSVNELLKKAGQS